MCQSANTILYAFKILPSLLGDQKLDLFASNLMNIPTFLNKAKSDGGFIKFEAPNSLFLFGGIKNSIDQDKL